MTQTVEINAAHFDKLPPKLNENAWIL